MSYSLKAVADISPELLSELAGNEQLVTHAHNPCLVDILHKTFGWKGGAFLVLDGDKVTGYFQCMFIKRRIVSMPHFSFGGLISCNPDRGEIYSEILPKLYEYFTGSYTDDISYLLREPSREGVFVQDNKVVSWINIRNKTVQQAIPASQLSKARKALEKGLTFKSGGTELLEDFYYIYSWNMHRLGSPVLPKQLFSNILTGYANGTARIYCVYKENAPVGAAFLMSYMGFFENTWFSTLSKYNSLHPAQLLHREMISYSISESGHTYSFGRSSSGSGVHEFKRRWGTEETVMYWNYDRQVKLNLQKAKMLSKLWKLLPLAAANKIGPFFAKKFY